MTGTLNKYFRFVTILTGATILFYGCATIPVQRTPDPELTEVSSTPTETSSADPVESETDSTTEQPQTPEPSYRFTDVPVPSKFKLDRSKSFTYEAGSIKAGLVTYYGRAKLDDLIDFYKKEMPNYEWEILSAFEHKNATLVFTKEGWNCTVNISYSTLSGSEIIIQIGPINTP